MAILLAVIFMNDSLFYEVPEPFLNQAGVADVGYGFQLEGITYLGYLTRIVALDKEGKTPYLFEKKGRGPRELMSGGPIFGLNHKIYCHDVLGHKLAVFGLDLNYEKDASLKKYPSGRLYFVNNGKKLFSISYSENGKRISIDKWNLKSLKPSLIKEMVFDFEIPLVPLTASFSDQNTILFMEKLQIRDHILLHTFDINTESLNSYGFPNPDFDKRAENSVNLSYFNVMQYGLEISSICSDQKNIYIFAINYDPGQNPRLAVNAGYRYFAINKQSKNLIDLKEIPYTSVSGHHFGALQVMENENGEIVVAHPKYFLN